MREIEKRQFAKAVRKKEPEKGPVITYATANANGTVVIDGYDVATPCKSSVEMHQGDRVRVSIENHKVVVTNNLTRPSINDEDYPHVKNIAVEANSILDSMGEVAEEADTTLAQILSDAVHSAEGLAEIETYVGYAEGYNQTLAAKVDQFNQRAQQGLTDIAEDVVRVEREAANAISTVRQETSTALESIGVSVQAAADAAAEADRKAVAAGQAAAAAQTSANIANKYSNAALDQLGVVQDVVGVLTWASEHGSFTQTSDQSIVEGKVYFTYDSTTHDYTPVVDPQASALSTYYELTVDEAMQSFIMAHLAVTTRGLWVLPAGLPSTDQTVDNTVDKASNSDTSAQKQANANARKADDYKVLLSNDGLYVYDGDGVLVSTFGENITFNSTRAQYIGNEDAYIIFTPEHLENGQSVPTSLVIGGSNVQLGSSRTLSQWLSDMQTAVTNAANAVQTANDVPIVTLSSTNGTVFKRNLGVSTTIVATIFTPGGRIDNATTLHSRFGNGAYLEWGWRDVVTDASHVLLSSDTRIGNGGFTLTVSPDDIDTQAVITCSLNY